MLSCNLESPFDIDRWSKTMRFIKPDLRPWILPFPNTWLGAKPLTVTSDRLIDDVDPSNMFFAVVSVAYTGHVLLKIL